MAQFSKFIRPGSRILFTGDERSIAAYDAAIKQLTIVTCNTGDSREVSYDLSAFQIDDCAAKVYRTSQGDNLAESELSMYSNGFTLELDGQSVTTVVLSNITFTNQI
jgi:hypothetical protein